MAVVLGSHLPFFLLHLYNLWRYRPHYEFFPLVLVVAAWLMYRRWPRGPVRHTRVTRIAGMLLLVVGCGFLAAAVLMYSPWLAAVATLLSLGGTLLRAKGTSAWHELTGAWLLLWLLVPPPLRWDDDLIRLLQGFTAWSSSGLLELLQVNHLLSGHIFRLPNRELFVAEACSGVHSQLVLIAIGIVIAIAWRRGPLHSMLLVATSVFCAAIVNTARVTLIVLAAARWDVDLSTGWQHEVLGYSLVGVGLLLLLSADQFLCGLLAPVLDFWNAELDPDFDPEEDKLPEPRALLPRIWNRLAAGYWPAAPRATAVQAASRPPQRATRGQQITVTAPFACLAVLQIVVLIAVRVPEVKPQEVATGFQEDWLPERVGQWRREEFIVEERESTSDWGEYSRIWRFQSPDRKVRVSVDYPFVGWHALERCYSSVGWRETSRAVRADEETGPYMAVELSQPGGQHGYLLYSLLDGDARPVSPRASHWPGLRGKLARSPLAALFGFGPDASSGDWTTLQVQQFIIGNDPLDASQRTSAEQMYLDFRRRLVSRWRAKTAAK